MKGRQPQQPEEIRHMTYNDMLDSGIGFQSEVRLCYYDYDKEERINADWVKNPALYVSCCNQGIKYFYTDQGPKKIGELVIYIEV